MAYYFALGPWYSRSDQDAVQKETFELLKKNSQRAPINVKVYLVDLGRPTTIIVWEEFKKQEMDAMGGPYSAIRKWVTDSGGESFDDADLVCLRQPLELPGQHLSLQGLSGFKGIIDSFFATHA